MGLVEIYKRKLFSVRGFSFRINMIVKPQFHRNKESSSMGNRVRPLLPIEIQVRSQTEKYLWGFAWRQSYKEKLKKELICTVLRKKKTNSEGEWKRKYERRKDLQVLIALLFRWFNIFFCKNSFTMCLCFVMHANTVVDQCCLKTLQKCLLLCLWIVVEFTSMVNILSLVCVA